MKSANGSDPAEYFVLMVQGTDYSIHTVNTTTKTSTGESITDASPLKIRGVYCSVAGDIKMEQPDATITEFVGMVAGATYPLCPVKIAASTSGTDATLIALYG